MLLFRSEEHIDEWCRQWGRERGEAFTLRRTMDEAHAIFARIGLTSPFWRLG
jgi:hypothetical protein